MKKKVHSFVKVHGNGHIKYVADFISKSWNQECYFDVRLTCKDYKQSSSSESKVVFANKCVLAAASKKFAAMLTNTEEDTLMIFPDYDYDTLKLLIQYIYSGEVLVDSFTNELKQIILEWGVDFPEIIPVTLSKSVTVTEVSLIGNKSSGSKGLQTNVENPQITEESCNNSTTSLKTSNRSVYEGCGGLEKHLLEQPSIDVNRSVNTVGATWFSGLLGDTAGLSESNQPMKKVQVSVNKRKTTSASKSSSYVFLATYIKNSKSLLQKTATDPITTSENTGIENRQTLSTEVVNEASADQTITSGSLLPNEERYVNATKKKRASVIKGKPSTRAVKHNKEKGQNKTDDMDDTEQDLEDLKIALQLLKEEKERRQELSARVDTISNEFQRHKTYAKHFLGFNAINSDGRAAQRAACETCGKMVYSDYMSTHVRIHTSERSYLCEQCGQTFALPERLRHHLKYTHADDSEIKLHVCPDCGKSFKKADYLQRHITLHNGQKPYQCPYCDKSFRLPNVLLKHKRVHTGEKPYECEVCHKRFSARTNYVVHVRTHRNKSRILETTVEGENCVDPVTQLLKCDVCNTTFHREYAFLIHKAAHKGEDPKLPCRHCRETFCSYKQLKEHTRIRHADALFQCDKCPSVFVQKAALLSHLLIHTQGKQFQCDLCDKGFQTKIQLNTHHSYIHSNIRPFTCRFCDKTFKSKLTQRQHERIHTGERPYQCPHCPKAFRQDVHLTNHIRQHTGEKPFVCPYCSKAFAIKNNLSVHIRIHTGDKNQCKICGQIFRTLVKLRLHESTHDPPSIPVLEEEITEQSL